MLPVKAPSKVPATKVSAPTVHLSALSSHNKVLSADVPLFTSIPLLTAGAPDTFEFNVIILSSISNTVLLRIVVVPSTVKFPLTVRSLNVLVPDDAVTLPTSVPVTVPTLILPCASTFPLPSNPNTVLALVATAGRFNVAVSTVGSTIRITLFFKMSSTS